MKVHYFPLLLTARSAFLFSLPSLAITAHCMHDQVCEFEFLSLLTTLCARQSN